MARIGIMGGTFDPIHMGHLQIGRQAKEEYGLEQVWFMPSGQPPHKKDHRVTAAPLRCAMVELAIEGQDGFVSSRFEVERPGNTYTAQTLALLKEAYPEHDFYFIIGADSLYEIEKWYEPEKIMAQTVLLVAGRAYDRAHPSMDAQMRYLTETYGARICPLHCPQVDISSEEIRSLAAGGAELTGLLPEKVIAFIKENGLYKETQKYESKLSEEKMNDRRV